MSHYTKVADLTQEARKRQRERKKHNSQRFRANNPEYREREQSRLEARTQREWSVADSIRMAVDGEDLHDDANYSQFTVGRQGVKHEIRSPRGHSLTLLQIATLLFKVKRANRKHHQKSTRFYGYYLGWDWHMAILHDPLVSLEQKYAIRMQLSKAAAAIRTTDYSPVVELPQYGLGITLRPKTLYIYKYKMHRGVIARDDDGAAIIINRVKIEDIGTIFACRFDKALDQFRSLVLPEDIDQFQSDLNLLKRGKEARGDFAGAGMTTDDVARYNYLEIDRLAWLVDIMVTICNEVGLHPSSFAGPKPFATALVNKYKLGPHIKREDNDTVEYQEGPAMRWHRACFFGGDIECFVQGLVKEWCEVDTRNAYVKALAEAECAAHAIERELTAGEIAAANAGEIHSQWQYTITWKLHKGAQHGLLPMRYKSGIYYPTAGKVSTYGVDIQVFFKYMHPDDQYNITAGLAHISTCEDGQHPYRVMCEETYEARKQYKRDGKLGHAEVIKKPLLSIYGATAQAAGGYRIIDKETGETLSYHTPPNASLHLAGFITAYERARQLEYRLRWPDQVIGHATDAGFFIGPDVPPEIRENEGDSLGEVEIKKHGATYFIAAGIRSAENPKESKSRGFSVPLSLDEIVKAKAENQEKITYNYRHFVGLQESLHCNSGKISLTENAGTFITVERDIDITENALSSKRDVQGQDTVQMDGYVWAHPYRTTFGPSELYTRPYDLKANVVESIQRNREEFQP